MFLETVKMNNVVFVFWIVFLSVVVELREWLLIVLKVRKYSFYFYLFKEIVFIEESY